MVKQIKVELPLKGEALEEVCMGMIFASLAITDNKEGTLSKVGRANPWQIEALTAITGSEEQAHKPLSTILHEDMGQMILDKEIDISGVTRGGHFLDTQGYIAHNDEYIVLAFRCTTSAFDWLTNFNTTSSAWEIQEDLKQGYSGFCSGFDNLCCTGEYKPRVHTGFYNNFLAALPTIQAYINPLLGETEPPRKLFVVGHSLGAGMATLAGAYFLTEYNWDRLPQRLVTVTAGSPRACCVSMKALIDEKRSQYGNKCRMYRLVKGNDVVTSVPPKIFGFCHLIDPIKITDSGHVVLRTKEDDPETDLMELTKYKGHFPSSNEGRDEEDDEDIMDRAAATTDTLDSKTKYDRMVARVPKALRDHMPDFYLKPLFKLCGMKHGSLRQSMLDEESDDEEETLQEPELHEKSEEPKVVAQRARRTWIPRMLRKKNVQPIGPTYF